MEKETRKQLQTGDVIFCCSYKGELTDRVVIDRITKTLAISANLKFKREHSVRGVVYPTKNPTGSTSLWFKSNPDLHDKWERQSRLNFIRQQDWNALSNEILDAVICLIDSQNEKKQ